jgi:Tfp pilus assembly protein PilX
MVETAVFQYSTLYPNFDWEDIMQALNRPLKNQRGSMMVVVIMILALLTLFGTVAITTSNTELETAGSEQIYKMAFFAAETGLTYVEQNPDTLHRFPGDQGMRPELTQLTIIE